MPYSYEGMKRDACNGSCCYQKSWAKTCFSMTKHNWQLQKMFLRDFAINFLCFCFSNKNIAITLWSLIETKNFRIKIIFGLPVSCNFDHKYKNNWRLRLLQSDQLKLIRTFCSVLFILFKRRIKDVFSPNLSVSRDQHYKPFLYCY